MEYSINSRTVSCNKDSQKESQILDTFYSTLEGAKKRSPVDIAREEAQLLSWQESKEIPREMLAEVWKAQFGSSGQGSCLRCKVALDVFSWEAAYLVAHSRGGKKVADNLRPVCHPCNKTMGDANMLEFRQTKDME